MTHLASWWLKYALEFQKCHLSRLLNALLVENCQSSGYIAVIEVRLWYWCGWLYLVAVFGNPLPRVIKTNSCWSYGVKWLLSLLLSCSSCHILLLFAQWPIYLSNILYIVLLGVAADIGLRLTDSWWTRELILSPHLVLNKVIESCGQVDHGVRLGRVRVILRLFPLPVLSLITIVN